MINTNETDDKTVDVIALRGSEKTGEVKEEDLALSIVPQNHLNSDKVIVDLKGEKILNEKHRKEIVEDSCVSKEIANSAFYTIDNEFEAAAYRKSNSIRQIEDVKGDLRSELDSGWAVNCVNPYTGKVDKVAGQFKPDSPSPTLGKDGKPKLGKDGKPKFNKYLSRSGGGTPMFLAMPDPEYWRKVINDETTPLLITEGAKKAGAALSLKHACVGLAGVNNAGDRDPVVPDEIHKDIQDFLVPGRTVIICYDADWWTNERVKLAILRLAKNMEKYPEVTVKTLLLPNNPEAKGIDDFIKKHGAEAFKKEIANAGSNLWSEGEISGHEFGKLLDTRLVPRMRFNILTQKFEVDEKESSLEEMTCLLEDECRVTFSGQSLKNRLGRYADKLAYNPVVEYLDGLKNNLPLVATAKDYFEGFVKDFFGSNEEDGSLLMDALKVKRWAISAIARAYEPGCKVDTALILLSPDQGIGKTDFFTTLANGHYVNMPATSTDKDGVLARQAGWLIDMGEIDATFDRKAVSEVKNNMTIQEDKVRPPYGSSVKTYKRHSVFCGTCNEETFLRDSTGSRRFLVVKARKVLLREEVKAARETFWQNALSLYLAGEHWWFTKQESDLISADNEQYSEDNPYLETIALALERAYSDKKMPNTALSPDQICTILLKLPVGSVKGKSGKQVVQAMKSLGYEPKRIRVGEKSTQVTFYVKPEWGIDYKFFISEPDCATWFH